MSFETDRKSERLPVMLEVHYQTVKDFIIDYAKNISKNGIFLQTEQPLPIHSAVNLSIHIPEGPVLEIVREVVHVIGSDEAKRFGREPGMGIEFIEYLGNAEQALEEYILMLNDKFDGLAQIPLLCPSSLNWFVKTRIHAILTVELLRQWRNDSRGDNSCTYLVRWPV